VFFLQVLLSLTRYEAGRPLQIAYSIIDEIISELKCFPLQSRAAELSRYYPDADAA